jgi:predicted nuclease with RNAse H fold
MSEAQPVFIGLDTTAGQRAATLAVLNAKLSVLHCDDHPIEQALQIVASYPHAVCGIDAPIEHSRMVLAEPTARMRVGLEPRQKNYQTYRVCEYELRRRGIHSYKTPTDRSKAPGWMQAGWQVYDRLRAMGYVAHPYGGQRVMFETYPHAAYTMMLKRRPYPKASLEGRVQRQLVLYREGVEVADPMDFFEEWTRHSFLAGKLLLDRLYEHDALDALLAAYTAFLLYREPHNVTAIGELADGQILVPVPVNELLDVYA